MQSTAVLTVEPGIHPAALLFPPMTATEYASLLASIREDGQLEAIVLHEGHILDGRHRWRACREIGVEPQTRAYMGECGTPLRFVIAENLSRRHMTPSQAATVAVEALPLFEAEAKEAQRQHAGTAPGKPAESLPQSFAEVIPEQRQPREAREARGMAATAFGTSRESVRKAEKVAEKDPHLFAEVKAGKVTVDAATKTLAKRDEAETSELLAGIGGERLAGLRAAEVYARAVARITSDLLPLNAAVVAEHLRDGDWAAATRTRASVDAWFERLEAAHFARPRVVERTATDG